MDLDNDCISGYQPDALRNTPLRVPGSPHGDLVDTDIVPATAAASSELPTELRRFVITRKSPDDWWNVVALLVNRPKQLIFRTTNKGESEISTSAVHATVGRKGRQLRNPTRAQETVCGTTERRREGLRSSAPLSRSMLGHVMPAAPNPLRRHRPRRGPARKRQVRQYRG